MIFDNEKQKEVLIDVLEKHTQKVNLTGNLTDIATYVNSLVQLKNSIFNSAVIPIMDQVAYCRTRNEQLEAAAHQELLTNAVDLIPEDKKMESEA